MSWDKLWWQKRVFFFWSSIVLRFFFFLYQALPPCLPVPPSYSSTRLDNSDFCEQQRHYLYVQCPANVWFLDCRSSRAILSHQTSTPITQFHPAAMEALFRWYTGLLFSDRLFLLALFFKSVLICFPFLLYIFSLLLPDSFCSRSTIQNVPTKLRYCVNLTELQFWIWGKSWQLCPNRPVPKILNPYKKSC